LHASIGAAAQGGQADDEHDDIGDAEDDVVPAGVPLAFLDEEEPEKRREVEGEATDEQTGNQTQQCVEERDGLCDNPGDDDLTAMTGTHTDQPLTPLT